MSTILEFPTLTDRGPAVLDRSPTEAELFPHLGKDDACIYCGVFQTDEQAEADRTITHIARDLAAVHRVRETLRTQFGIEHPGYDADVYDLLCELDIATRAQAPALAETAVAR